MTVRRWDARTIAVLRKDGGVLGKTAQLYPSVVVGPIIVATFSHLCVVIWGMAELSLLKAASIGDLDKVRTLLRAGHDVNERANRLARTN